MPACRGALCPNRATPVLPEETARHPAFGGARSGTADVSVLEVERVLRRMAIQRTGHAQVEAAFEPVRLARLRGVLALAVTARAHIIGPAPRRH